MIGFPNFIQLYKKDCGPTCLKIIAKYYKRNYNINELVRICNTNKLGTSFSNLNKAAEKIGFNALGVQITPNELLKAPLPCILLYDNSHYNVLYKIKRDNYHISDPETGLIKLSKKEFLKHWLKEYNEIESKGICLLLETTSDFYKGEKGYKEKLNLNFIKDFIKPQKKLIFQLFLGLLIGAFAQLLLPFITQSIVDKGIVNKDINFIYLLLIAQLVFYLSYIIVEWMRTKILVYLGSKIKIHLISSFISRLINMPISFFDIKSTGDILVRLKDQKRIKQLLTSSSLEFIFSIISLLVFSTVLAIYNFKLFVIFFSGTLLFFVWFASYLKRRAFLDHHSFKLEGRDSTNIVDMVDSMQDIKLNNAEYKQRWKWEAIQLDIFDNEIKKNKIINLQVLGSQFINEVKNIVITFYAAYLTLMGELTLGMLLAVMFIIAQLNIPLSNIIVFIQEFQDAILSIKRLNNFSKSYKENFKNDINKNEVNDLVDITIQDLNFKYPGSDNYILRNINLKIPKGSKTAIVGESGSGKTTLLKLLLKYYPILEGNIYYGHLDINYADEISLWKNIGAVLQDGKILNESIQNNICLSKEYFEKDNFNNSVEVSNSFKFISRLPMKEETLIGASGMSISGGEKQRILIARAIYKNPKFLFFDEATSSLDTENEKVIVENLKSFTKNRTTVTIAHRLSTVVEADQIIVLKDGMICEIGAHKELLAKKSIYYELIKNQLEISK